MSSPADDTRAEVKALMMVLIDLADYSRQDLMDIVDDAVEGIASEGLDDANLREFTNRRRL